VTLVAGDDVGGGGREPYRVVGRKPYHLTDD
jgi:hypothetical protein